MGLLDSIFGDPNQKRLRELARSINARTEYITPIINRYEAIGRYTDYDRNQVSGYVQEVSLKVLEMERIIQQVGASVLNITVPKLNGQYTGVMGYAIAQRDWLNVLCQDFNLNLYI